MFVVLSLMWIIEFMTEVFFSYPVEIIADVIKVISAAIIAQSLLANPKVRAFGVAKYISLKNNFEDANTVLV